MPSVMPFLGLARSSYSARQGAQGRRNKEKRRAFFRAPEVSAGLLRPRLGPEVAWRSGSRVGAEPTRPRGSRLAPARGSKPSALLFTSWMRLVIPASTKVETERKHASLPCWPWKSDLFCADARLRAV